VDWNEDLFGQDVEKVLTYTILRKEDDPTMERGDITMIAPLSI
jgi:hypothetical protein